MRFRRLAIRLLFVLGVVAIGFLIFFWRTVRVGAVENPPCHACSAIYGAQPQIPTVTLCDLLRNSSEYNDRIVRVHARLNQDSDYISLSDASMPCGNSRGIYAEFQPSFAACDGARKSLTIYTGYDPEHHRYDGVADAILVGRWHIDPSVQSVDGPLRELSIVCLETVAPVRDPTFDYVRYFMSVIARHIH